MRATPAAGCFAHLSGMGGVVEVMPAVVCGYTEFLVLGRRSSFHTSSTTLNRHSLVMPTTERSAQYTTTATMRTNKTRQRQCFSGFCHSFVANLTFFPAAHTP